MKPMLMSLGVIALLLSACADRTAIHTRAGDTSLNTVPNLSDLVGQSELIVTGTVTSSGDTWNIARGADPTTPSTTTVVLAQNFALAVDGVLKGAATPQITWAVVQARGLVSAPLTFDADWMPPTIGGRYLLFLVRIPGTQIYGIPAEPSRFRLAADARPESKWKDASRYYPPAPIATLLEQVRAAARP